MFLRPKDQKAELGDLSWLLNKAVEASRFRAKVATEYHPRWKRVIRIDTVRLRKKKEYCGQHPNGCVPNLFVDKPHRHGTWLEGSDWVGFNDGLNDVLDKHNVNADVWSFNRESLGTGRYFLRKGLERRLDYDSEYIERFGRGFYAWVQDGEHENWCGKTAPRSVFPKDTPGYACWSVEQEAALDALMVG